ncbi:MAG: thioredoxin family protein [Cyanobacteria bacterium J06626_14]
MVLTASTMLELGTSAPAFELPDVVTGSPISLETFKDKSALLIMFICRHCPFVKHVQAELAKIGTDYANSELGIVAISANDAEKYPDDAPDSLKEMVSEMGFNFPFCFDETQEVAKIYTAACTPDFFLFDRDRCLVYRGQLDDSRPGNDIPVTGGDLRNAIDTLISGTTMLVYEQKPSIGCNIKWKPGNEPSYFGAG